MPPPSDSGGSIPLGRLLINNSTFLVFGRTDLFAMPHFLLNQGRNLSTNLPGKMGLFARFKSANKSRDNGTEMVCATLQGASKAEYCPRAEDCPRAKPKGNLLPAGIFLPEVHPV